jgi:hypothetical protein
MKRLFSLLTLLALGTLLVAGCASGDAESKSGATAADTTDLPTVTVYKSPTCGCCAKWVDHMKAAGFTVETRDVDDVRQKKDQFGVPQQLRSCHTAYAGGEVFEGHIPADVIKQYLANDTSKARGLAVPGMPIGSPGMEVPGRLAQPYEVFAFRGDGRAAVYSRQRSE